MFENLSRFEPSGISAQTQLDISEHLQSLEKEFRKYFPDLAEGVETFPRNPFLSKLNIETVPDEVQDELLDLRNDSAGREIFKEKSLSEFWCTMFRTYPILSMAAPRIIVPFASTYLCESGFSTLVHIKSKARNQLNVEDDMRLAISKTQPCIAMLAAEMQQQISH